MKTRDRRPALRYRSFAAHLDGRDLTIHVAIRDLAKIAHCVVPSPRPLRWPVRAFTWGQIDTNKLTRVEALMLLQLPDTFVERAS